MAIAIDLPKPGGQPFLIDGGLETCLIFHDGFDLPAFASFTLLENDKGVAGLRSYYRRYLDIARQHETGYVFDAPTWRASQDWGAVLGYDRLRLGEANRQAIALVSDMRAAEAELYGPIVINAPIGPRGDGYVPGATMTASEARNYHAWQVETVVEAGADMVSALTMTNVEEAEGIAAAACAVGIPVGVSFTVETDGRLPTGMALGEAIARIDDRHGDGVAFYMINCAHPSHFSPVLDSNPEVASRIGGIRANASRMSHSELDSAPNLDEGDPTELGRDYRTMLDILPSLCLLGGCCGTDHRHVAAIAEACVPILKRRTGS